MSKRVVILGAAFGELELASMLSEEVADQVEVTLIDKVTRSLSVFPSST